MPTSFFIVLDTALGLQVQVQLVPLMQVSLQLLPEHRGQMCGKGGRGLGQANGGLRVTVFRAVVRHTMRRAPGGFLCKGGATSCVACLGRGQTQYGRAQTRWVMGGVLFRVWLCMLWVGLVSGSGSGRGRTKSRAGIQGGAQSRSGTWNWGRLRPDVGPESVSEA